MSCGRVAAIFTASLLVQSCLLLLYCEVVHHYVVQLQCGWPELPAGSGSGLSLMVVSDTHLLGRRQGHWLDRLRREWQMHRSYLSALSLHRPDAVLFLGDLYDEGKWSGEEEFAETVGRFERLFPLPEGVRRLVVAGNHDIGFHYSARPQLWRRFDRTHGTAGVSLTSLAEDVHLVLINSVAMEGDECGLCTAAQQQLRRVSEVLRCSEPNAIDCATDLPRLPRPSRPLLLQHYPLWRRSDAACRGPEAAPEPDRSVRFRPGWECVSAQASEAILSRLRPRLVLSGHTHHYCRTQHPADGERPAVTEYSVPSFSWRNRNNPAYLMVRVSGAGQAVNICRLAEENTVFALYLTGMPAALVLSFVVTARRRLLPRWAAAASPPRPSTAKRE